METFDLNHYSDGRPQQFGNSSNLDEEDTIAELLYFDQISEKYTEEDLTKILRNIPKGNYYMIGSRWAEIKIYKNN